MSMNKVVGKLFRFKGLRVVGCEFQTRRKAVELKVKPHKNGCLCPKCGRRGKIICRLQTRWWHDVVVCGWTVWLHYPPREIMCRTHGRIQEQIPWAPQHSRITYRLEHLVLVYCQLMTQKAAAGLLQMPTSTLSDLLHAAIRRIRDGHKVRGLKTIGIDEISYAKGHKYATIVYDLDRSCVVWVGRGKGRETIDTFFNEVLSAYQKEQIQWACCDMSEAYIGAISDHCPNAVLVLDRFHVVKALNDAVDAVRKEQWRTACAHERKAMKGLRWVLYRHSSSRTKEDTEALKALEKANNRIYRAWRLKDEFEQFWDYKAPWAAERFLKRWTTAALRSRLDPLRKFVHTIRKHFGQLLGFISCRLTNAMAEGLNRIIKIVKNRASGFRSLDAFTDMIFLTVGDVDIPAQIPPHFRTI